MNGLRLSARAPLSAPLRAATPARLVNTRIAAFTRSISQTQIAGLHSNSTSSLRVGLLPLRSQFLPESFLADQASPQSRRSLHQSSSLRQEKKKGKDAAKDGPKEESATQET